MTGYVVCYSTCWACKFDQHDRKWHPWADGEDISWAAAKGQPDPSGQKCGCYCCADATAPENPAHRPTSTEEK